MHSHHGHARPMQWKHSLTSEPKQLDWNIEYSGLFSLKMVNVFVRQLDHPFDTNSFGLIIDWQDKGIYTEIRKATT